MWYQLIKALPIYPFVSPEKSSFRCQLPRWWPQKKKDLTDWCTCMGKKGHGLSGSVFFNHSHLALRAHPSCCKLVMPNPPNSGGRVTLGQVIKQSPPFTSFLPLHRKPLLILSMDLSAQVGRSTAMAKYTIMEVSTNWTSTFLPSIVNKSTFQPGNWSAIFINYWLDLSLGQFV